MYIKAFFILSILLLTSGALLAQTAGIGLDILVQPDFFIAILSGVVLALGIQVLLTALSIAVGISSVGDIRKKFIDSQYDMEGRNHWNESTLTEEDTPSSKVKHPGIDLMNTIGIWSLITVGLSLFIASYLALKLTLIASPAMAITLSLVIWSMTLMILFYFESRLAKTLIGSLISVATTGLKSSAAMLTNMLSTSQDEKTEQMIDHTISRIRKEFEGSMDTKALRAVVQEHADALKQNKPDLQEIKEELLAVMNQSDEALKESKKASAVAKEAASHVAEKNTLESKGQGKSAIKSTLNAAKWVAIQAVLKSAIKQFSAGMSLSDKLGAKQMSQLLNELEEAYSSGESMTTKAQNIAQVLSPLDKKVTEEYIGRVLNYLKTNSDTAHDQETVLARLNGEKDAQPIDPEEFHARLSLIDSERIEKYLEKDDTLHPEQKQETVSRLRKLVDDLRASYADLTVNGPNRLKSSVNEVLEDFFEKVDRPELDYEALKADFEKILDDPKEGIETIKARISKMDHDTMWSLLEHTVGISKEHKERVVDQLEQVTTGIKDKVDHIEHKADQVIQRTKRQAVIKAENTRRFAAVAAWWLVITFLCSALAAMAGGLLSV